MAQLCDVRGWFVVAVGPQRSVSWVGQRGEQVVGVVAGERFEDDVAPL